MNKNKKSILTLFTTWAACCLAVISTSCSMDPVAPTDETKNKLHEDPSRMTITLVESHLHADWKEIQEIGGLHQNPESPAKHLKRIQKITYEVQPGKGWGLAEGSPDKFYVLQNGEYRHGDAFTPAPVYLLLIQYFNAEGKLINGQLCEDGQDLIHQHFFSPVNVQPTADGKVEQDDTDPSKMFDYLYADTDPWNHTHHEDHAEITGDKNPIGLKGVIRFLKDRKQFDLNIRLYHGYSSKINPQTGHFDPFYKPSGILIQQGTWDINVKVPVVVYMSKNDLIDIDENADPAAIPEDSLDKDSNRNVHSIMNAFHISWEEALSDFIAYTFHAGDVESGHIYL